MHTIKATVKGGRLDLDVPADWPDGTEVEIHPVGQAGKNNDGPRTPDATARNRVAPDSGEPCQKKEEEPPEEGWSNSPEAIADWLRWYDSLQPLILTPEEEADAEAWMRKANDYFTANIDKGVEDLFG